MWIAGRRDSTVFGVVDDSTTTKFANRACAVHGISLPVVVDKVVVVVLKFPNEFPTWNSDMRVKHAKETNASKYVTRPGPKMSSPMILIPLMALDSTYLKISRKMRLS